MCMHSCDAGGGDVSRKEEGGRGGTGVCWGGGLTKFDVAVVGF